MTSFEKFLEAKFAEIYQGIDDDMPEAFEDWIGELDNQELIDFAEEAIISAREVNKQ